VFWRRPSRARHCLLIAFLVSLASCSSPPEDEVWILGLDGADWDVLEPMLARGDLPNLERLRSQGTWGRLMSEEPMLSPILWTTLATGRSPDVHGVTWFMSEAPDGSKIPVSSHNREVRALWNIASEHGLSVGILGWWATWPAEPVRGFVVSDYVGWHSFGVTGRRVQAPGKTWPAELEMEIGNLMPRSREVPVALMKRFLHLPESRLRGEGSDDPYEDPVNHLRQTVATTIGYTRIALNRLSQEHPRLFAIYYEGTDAVQHLFTNYAPPRLPWVSDEDFAAYRDAVAQYFKWQDEMLGRLLAERGPNTTVVVVSDHGFRTGDERLKEEPFRVETADASHLPDGILILNGPGIEPGGPLPDADLYDVAPTVLHLLGIPVAEDLQGEVITAALTRTYLKEHPIRTVATYETGPWDRGREVALDPEGGERMESMLRSLGYIASGEEESADEAGDVAGSKRESGPTGGIEQAVNLAVVLRKQGRHDEAAATLEKALEEHPGHVESRSNLARIYVEMNRFDEAETIYRGLVEEAPDNLSHREDLGLTLARAGDFESALEVFEAGLERRPDWVDGLAQKGFCLLSLEQPAEALEAVDGALAHDPRSAEAHYVRGMVLEKLEKPGEARASLERALELDPTHPEAALELSILRERLGDPGGAIEVAKKARAQGARDPRLAAQLGALYLRTGRWQEALPLLGEASEERPGNTMILGNYGTALAMSGDMTGAAQVFEKIVRLDPESPEARAQLGVFYLRMRRPEKAGPHLKEAVRLEPDNAQLRFHLASYFHATGKLDSARTHYEEAIRLDPKVGIYQYQLGMLYAQMGDQARARELVQEARRLDPRLPPPGGR
jgi:tetratricopeptide (TPR) repeat protein/predicted AlkP superfamily phosphohydrolase/phosphomutase